MAARQPASWIRDRIAQLREYDAALLTRQAAEGEAILHKRTALLELDNLINQATYNPMILVNLSQVKGRTITLDYLIRRRREIEAELIRETQEYQRILNERRQIADEIMQLTQQLVAPQAFAARTAGPEAERLMAELARLRMEIQRKDLPGTAYVQYMARIREIERRLRELGYL